MLPVFTACGTQGTPPVAQSSHAVTSSYGSARYAAASTHVSWVEPSHHKGRLWPIYNTQWAMNNRLRGGFNHWTLPAAWVPYLQSSQKPILPYFTSKRGFLFITLQGTVYLYSTLSQSGWPIHPFADIPPDATIVAEYVPLSPAVKEGIVPVYNGQPFTSGMTLPPIWKQVTHLSAMPMKGAT